MNTIHKKIHVAKISYLIIAISLTLWGLYAYFTINQLIQTQNTYENLIKISQKQQLLSQKTALIASRYFEEKNSSLKEHLEQLTLFMKSEHLFLVDNLQSQSLRDIYLYDQNNINKNISYYLSLLEQFHTNSDLATLNKIKSYSFEILPRLNDATHRLEGEAQLNIKSFYNQSWYIFLGISITLVLEFFLIIFPTIKSLEKSKEKLLKYNNQLSQEVENQTKRLNDFIEASTDFVWEINSKGAYIYVSDRVKEILGYEVEEIIGKTPFDLMDPEEAKDILNTFEYLVQNKLPIQNLYNWNIKKNGDKVYLLTNGIPFYNEEGLFLGYRGTDKDVSKKKLFEEQAKLAAMGEMIGNIAHQWRQPLSVISAIASGVQYRKEYGNLDEYNLTDGMETIMTQTNYLSKTIDDFRNFIKNDKDKQSLGIVNIINKTITIVGPNLKNNNIELHLDCDDDYEIFGYENNLIQAFINIINNAKDAINDRSILNNNGVIIIKTKKMDHQYYSVIIQDNAGGIPENIVNKIFEPYFTTKNQSFGTGIGLSMAHTILVEQHNAQINVSNNKIIHNDKEYIGACFTILFKLNQLKDEG